MLHTPDTAEARRALLAKYLRGGLAQETRDAIPCHASDEPAPLSFGQQQLWLLAQLVPDEPVYNECVTIHLPGPLDIAVFERSFNEIIRRHEAWRTSFPLVDGQPVQMVHPPV
ncbi:MAG TPA: condensation domain-containing protein, partial [Ktedonobacteraceae bacterium]|nr:condensation domain-containing protein [Ktedonobacteraceae bacterium]